MSDCLNKDASGPQRLICFIGKFILSFLYMIRICGVRIEEIEDPKMRDMRVLDKLVDELAKGKPVEKILNL